MILRGHIVDKHSIYYYWDDHIMVLILISSETHLGLAPMKMTILCCHGTLRPAPCQTKEVKDFFSWQLHVLPLFFTTRECCEKHRLQVLEAGSKEVQILQLPQ